VPILPYGFNLLSVLSLFVRAADREDAQLCLIERHVAEGEA
jgi:hypothetical protein